VRRRRAVDAARDPACHGQDGPRGHVVQTAADVRRVLAEEIAQLTANPDLEPLGKAGRLAQLARVALRAIELANLEARVEAVEAVLRLRKDEQLFKEGS
jgi:hypothetical protein